MTVAAEGKMLGSINTAGATIEPGYAVFALPPASRHFQIRVTSGEVRAFGVRFEKPGPGIEYDSLGLNGAFVSVLAKAFNGEHWEAELQRLQPDLVIINYGTNESGYATFVDQSYGKELTEVVRRIRAALPEASILLMSPMDRGVRESS